MTPEAAFKQCTLCPTIWVEAEDFIRDLELRVEGYLAAFKNPDEGLILVTHRRAGCGTTLAIPAGTLKRFYHGPEYTAHHTGDEDCPRHCVKREDFELCDVECDMAWVRQIIQLLARHEVPPA